MSPERYTVSNSQRVGKQYRDAMRTARDRGILSDALRATAWIMEELARTPMEFGESRGVLPHLQLHLRLGFAGPLAFWFAVHEPNKQVFVTAVALGRARHPK